MTPRWDDMVVVGRIARPHGLSGHLVVAPQSDFAEERFRPGQVVYVEVAGATSALTISAARFHQGRAIVAFEGVTSIEAAEAIGRGDVRIAPADQGALPAGVYFHHQLEGCVVSTTDGTVVGEVVRVDGAVGSSLLVVRRGSGEVLVPLASEICVEVEPAARRIVIAPPEGLLDLNESRR